MSSEPDSNSGRTLLEKLVYSLKLSKGRINAVGSASSMTPQTAQNAGFLFYDSWEKLWVNSMANKVGIVNTDYSLSGDILTRLNDIKRRCLEAQARESVEIKADIPDIVVAKDIKGVAQLVNGLNTLVLHYVNNNLSRDGFASPFILHGQDWSESKNSTRSNLPESFKRIKIEKLPESDDDPTTEDSLDEALSWFHALFLTAKGHRANSEMAVQHLIGGPLHALARLPGCHILSDQNLEYPDILKLSIHDPDEPSAAAGDNPKQGSGGDNSGRKKNLAGCHPDLVTQPDTDEVINKVKQLLLQPTLIVGEAKRVSTGTEKEVSDTSGHYTVQLAMAAHASLILLILLHLGGKEFDAVKHKKNLPADYFIPSVYYDEAKLLIYAQFPFYGSEWETSRPGWRFAQVKLHEVVFATTELALGQPEEDARRRTQFALATQVVREQARRLRTIFQSEDYLRLVDSLA
ncbi:hypothetical protein EIP86_008416 [Pleurotus ostreatoroseus]|nr:hypothetical protein EIP86_008416 [Pleurotus ostreatoroseus]